MRNKKVFDMVIMSSFIALILILSLIPSIGYIHIGVTSLTIIHIPVLVGLVMLGLKQGLILGLTFGLSSMLVAFMRPSGPFDYAFQNPLVSVLPRVLFIFVAYLIMICFKKINIIKNGKWVILAIVSAISFSALIFGADIVSQMASTISEGEGETAITFISWDKYHQIYPWILTLAIVLALLFIGFYLFLVLKSKEKNVLIPSVFIIGTIAHTFLVLACVGIFNPDLLGNQENFSSVMSLLYSIAFTNGLAEAIAALIIGTPICLAVKNVLVQIKGEK